MEKSSITKKEINKLLENGKLQKSQDICKLVESIGYGGFPNQFQCNNGAHVSSLLNFLDDNPAVIEMIVNFIIENKDEDEEEEDDDEEYEEEEEEIKVIFIKN